MSLSVPIKKESRDGEQPLFFLTLGAMCVGLGTVLFAALQA